MLLITPPINIFYFPMMTLPTLVAQLRNKGYDVSAMDMNIDFLRYVYSKDYLVYVIPFSSLTV